MRELENNNLPAIRSGVPALKANLPDISDFPYDSNYIPTKSGIFNIPEAEYRKIKALNITYAKLFNRSPAHVDTAINDPKAAIISPTLAMQQGTAFHWAVLEPDRFNLFVVPDLEISKNSNKYKEWKSYQGKNLILKQDDINSVKKMVKVLADKETPARYIAEGWPEKTIIWFESEYNIWCKGRIDWIRADGQALIDLKKTQNASKFEFIRAINRYDYYVQAAHYMRGYEQIMGYRPLEWVWIASEFDPPNECNVFIADNDEILNKESRVLTWYQRFQECQETGFWPGYPDEPVYLGVDPVEKNSETLALSTVDGETIYF